MKKPKHKSRPHRSHIKSKDWRGFVARNKHRWDDDNTQVTAIEEEVGYLGVYEKRFMKR